MGNNLGKNQMKKKQRVLTTMFCAGAFATALLLTSCGGSGGGGGTKNDVKFQKTPKNEILGDLVNISCEYKAKISASNAEYEEARDKNNEKYADNSDKRKQNWEKLKEQKDKRNKKIMEETNAAIEKEMATLIGKAIPFECEDGLGFEVVECKINKVDKLTVPQAANLSLSFTYKMKPVDAEKVKKFSNLDVVDQYKFVDASGNVLYENIDMFGNDMLGLKKGENVEVVRYDVSLGPDMANFAKIKFVKP